VIKKLDNIENKSKPAPAKGLKKSSWRVFKNCCSISGLLVKKACRKKIKLKQMRRRTSKFLK
jgi:hypothetical protein